jgi:hypothetical protein
MSTRVPTTSSGDRSIIRQTNSRHTSTIHSGARIWYQINILLALETFNGHVQKTEVIYVKKQSLYKASTEYENIHWPLPVTDLKDGIWDYLFRPVELLKRHESLHRSWK